VDYHEHVRIIYCKHKYSGHEKQSGLCCGAKNNKKEIGTMSENKEINKSMEKMDGAEIEQVAGGNDGCYGYNWVYGTVHDVVHYDASSCLTLRNCPNGDVMYTNAGKPMGWQNGESILVLPSSRQGNWIQAQWNGVIGWTNANYVWY